MEPKLMWHFCQVDDNGTPRLGYGDGRIVRVGETLTIDGEPVLCKRGLHASARLYDALQYANGDKLVLCRVQLGGEIVDGGDKRVATERTVVTMLTREQTDKLLRDFARWCALQVIDLWDAPDVARQYLETGDESLRAAARAAAWDAAWAAAWAAAEAAARDAAEAAARDAARAAKIEEYAAELERRAVAFLAAQD